MHGVPTDLSLAIFEDAVLDHITLARHTMAFVFESEAVLSVEGKWELTGPDNELVDHWAGDSGEISEHGPFLIHKCVGRRVTRTRIDPPHSIALQFDGDLLLRVFDTPHYESFHIDPGEVHV